MARRAFCWCLSLPLALLVLSLAGCAPAPEPELVRVGLLALMEGLAASSSGEPSIAGARLAIDEINAKGGVVLGGVARPLVLVVGEYEDRPDSATSVARELINREHVDLLLGPQISRHAIPVSLVAENAHVPMVSPMSSNPETTRGKRFVFRLAALDSDQAEVMARFALEELGARRAAILYDISTNYGRSLAAAFEEAFSGEGEVIAVESYTLDDEGHESEQLERIAEAGPDVLYLPSDTNHVRSQVVQARAQGIQAVLLGSDSWDLEFLKDIPEADGSFYAHQWHPGLEVEESRQFVELYTDRFGERPKVTAAMTYDGVMLFKDALERAGTPSPEAVRGALAATRGFRAVTGEIRFDEDGNPERRLIITRLVRGEAKIQRLAP